MSDAGPIPPADFVGLRLELVRLRHERGWTLNELAARAGVGIATLAAIESGKSRRNPQRPETRGSIETWYRISVALDVDLGDLLRPLYGKK